MKYLVPENQLALIFHAGQGLTTNVVLSILLDLGLDYIKSHYPQD